MGPLEKVKNRVPIQNRDVYKDRIYDVTTENKVIDLQNGS